ncbi:MAG TPA: heparinase II/III family protein [Candidatus Avipropionibacterium avicola]|uniref:Heparinase II/III family protein n=1 Tax=Candidatus Avipropionibacterium avicola TaxID=2840701 RepID=A0A9D1KMM3_9ACTN|nr:heparinase II/III family protein [Candidatus Avipropionibacterium avicola]
MATTIAARATIPDWDRARDRITHQTWATKVWEALLSETERWRDHLVIAGPDEPSAWTHHYFCDDDGTRLTFDPDLPHEHRCPTCSRVYDDELRIGAWRTTHHNAVAAQVQRDAVIMRLHPDPEAVAAAREELQSVITRYGNDYDAYPAHGHHAGIGKVLPQCLDESIWAISLLRAVRWVADDLDPDTLAAADRLAGGVRDLLRPQVSMIHNIHCWMLAALAECAIRLDDAELMDFTATSPFGAFAQLQQGFRPEGLWFEINPHYHYYTVDAVLAWLEAYGVASVPDELQAIVRRAVTAPALLAYSDHLVPAYADGWPDTPITNFTRHAEKAIGLLGPDGIDLSAFLPTGTRRDTEAALLHGPDQVHPPEDPTPATSFSWPGAGIALLRSPAARIVMRSGPDSGGHDHRDKLAIDIETAGGWRSLDLGTSGYGAEFTRWMRSPGAHSTAFVGAGPQPACDGRIDEFSDRRVVGSTSWPGCRMRRELALGDDGWYDLLEVDLDRADEITWVLHGDGSVVSVPPRTPATVPDHLSELQLGWLESFGQLQPEDGRLYVTWDRPGAPDLVVQVPQGFRCWAGEGPGNPSGHPLGTVVISGYAQSAAFSVRASVGG